MAEERNQIGGTGRIRTALNMAASELEDVHEWIERENLVEQFEILPPDNDYTFKRNGRGLAVRSEGTISSMKLFLGKGNEMLNYKPTLVETWALLETYPGKNIMTKVVFLNYNVGTRTWEKVSHFEELHLMYPFKVFKDYKMAHRSMMLFHSFIAYIFLECGHETEVFLAKMDEEKILLRDAIKRISDTYQKKGIENIPDLERPSSSSRAPAQPSFSRLDTSNPSRQPPQQARTDSEQLEQENPQRHERCASVAEEQELEPHERTEPPQDETRILSRIALEPENLIDDDSDTATSQVSGGLANLDLAGTYRRNPHRKRPGVTEDDYEVAKRLRLEQQRDDLEEREHRRYLAIARDRMHVIKYSRLGRKAALKKRLKNLTREQLIGIIIEEDNEDDQGGQDDGEVEWDQEEVDD